MRRTCVAFILFFIFSQATVCTLQASAGDWPVIAAGSNKTGQYPMGVEWPRKTNPLHVVVVFTRFKGELPADTTPPEWSKNLFNGRPGSINDYFSAISHGEFKITGEIFPKMIEMPHDTTYYKRTDTYSRDIIRMLDEDPDFSFARYDNDGLDREPNSGDDDGFADYIVLMPRSRPYDFILRLATGVMTLHLNDPYTTRDRRANGGFIKADKFSGCIAVAATYSQALGTITAEISHAFGALDLMDKVYETPATDSAGVGYWDILGWGAGGWAGNGVPVGPCAFNRMLMKCIGVNNSNLVDIYGAHKSVSMRDVGDPTGKVYRIWISPTEFFLIEYRNNRGNLYYDSFLPQSGLLIWHVQERESNSTEESKLCDLECPDGLYLDAGFPLGSFPDPLNGKDNLDFWSRNAQYTIQHSGNMGDASDVYDGVNYTMFGTRTNPSSVSNNKTPTGIEIFNIRRSGNEMLFDCYIPPIPNMQPPKAPSVGLAFQRSNGTSVNQFLDYRKNVYIVDFGLSYRHNLLITVTRDTLLVKEITDLGQYERQKAVLRSLSGDSDPESAMVFRESISPDAFWATAEQYGVYPGDLGAGAAPVHIQKLTLTEAHRERPTAIELRQNHPNPFNAETVIDYVLSESGPVTLEVYNILGQKVLELDQGFRDRGTHSFHLSAGDMSSGIYFYRLRGTNLSQTRRFTLIR